MAREKNSPWTMKQMVEPEEMSPINEMSDRSTVKPPVIEVTQPIRTVHPLEIREPGSITLL